MPLPMVHLEVAKSLIEVYNIINKGDFYLGTISPDAVHMRKNSSRDDKRITHLHSDNIDWKSKVTAFIKDNRSNDFCIGYGIHILTDIYWDKTLYNSFKTNYYNDVHPIQDEKWAYYNDTDILDFELFRTFDNKKEIWNYLNNCNINFIEGIITPDEVRAWKERTLHWYDSGESQHKYPIKYIAKNDLLNFILETSLFVKSDCDFLI